MKILQIISFLKLSISASASDDIEALEQQRIRDALRTGEIRIFEDVEQYAENLSLAGNIVPADDSDVPEQSEIDAEMNMLSRLAENECFYTGDCEITSDIASVGTDSDREYRTIEEKYFMMFEMLFRRYEPYKYACEEKGKRVIELRYLHENGRVVRDGKACSFRGKSPGKWLDWVIFYALEKRHVEIEEDDIFVGVAIYSEFYKVSGKHRDTLFKNLLNLYIRRNTLDGEKSFYSSVYTSNGKDLRDKQKLTLLEKLMKAILLKVLKILDMPCSVDREGINLRIYERIPRDLEGFYSKRAGNHLAVGSDIHHELVTFRNVIMEKVPSDSISEEYKKILLTLIGMVRSGKNTITAECRRWATKGDFNEFLRRVNPNRNLVGVTELHSNMDLESMLGGIKDQLRYLEIEFGSEAKRYDGVIKFIDSLNGITLKVSLFYCYSGTKIMRVLLDSRGVGCVSSLRILDTDNYRNPDYNLIMPMIMNINLAMLRNPKIHELELYGSKMSLEGFLMNGDFRMLRNKVRVLEVTGIGRIEEMADADLKSLKLERLQIDMFGHEDAVLNLDQLVNKGVITRDGFKYLIFRNIENPKNKLEIVDLRYKLGERKWPVMIMNFKPPGTANADYSRVCREYYCELHYM